ncbi:MAG: histidine kinase [Salinivirgaceae bacterium]|jgi:signal transduction histidine kinase|nr:histidine kinase [Salinivirgaceae bacterium]
MLRLVTLLISIVLQLIAAIFALRLMRVTKYRASWVLISLGFLLMAIKRAIKLIQFLEDDFTFYLTMADDWLAVVISFFFTAGVFLIGEIFYSLKRADIDRNRSEKRLLNAIIQTEEKERKRFAKDLHDGLGPLLSTVKMSISALLNPNANIESKTILKNTKMVINEAISSIKEISNNLSPHVLTNFGLVSALKNFTHKINEAKTVTIQLFSNMENERFNSNAEVILFRATCELINNTIKHAKAENISINISKHLRTLTIQYNDDGLGFDTDLTENNKKGGMGFQNISSRIKSINGVFIINSFPGEGTNALIKVRL